MNRAGARTAGAWFAVPATALLLLLPATPARAEPPLIHSERSLYRQVFVYGDYSTRCLCFTRECRIGRQSCIDLKQPDRLMFEYTQMMLGALLLNPDPHSILVIGLGGGTLPRTLGKLLPNADIDVVEIDPAVIRVAGEYFGYHPGAHQHVYEEDGRAYVRRMLRTLQRYQLIMLDAYDQQYIPEHLLTQEFLAQVRTLLAPGGIVAANTFSSSRLYQNESVTYRAVFGTFYNLKSANRVILASNAPLPGIALATRNAAHFDAAFTALGFKAMSVLSLFNTGVDWDPKARVLTDQYSPANLLNSAAQSQASPPPRCHCGLCAATASRSSCSLLLTMASLSGPSRTMSFWPADSDSIFGSAYWYITFGRASATGPRTSGAASASSMLATRRSLK
jgi:spermidine synthase